jgi:hypothetical protein
MFKQLGLFALHILPLALIGVITPAYAQKKVGIEIRNVSKNDAQAKKGLNDKGRLVPVNFQFICNGADAGKFSNLEAVLETVNTNGARSRVIKRITDGTSNTLREESIDLPMPDGVFARDFKLTLRGQFRLGNAANLIHVSEVKTGSFPAPANLTERKN